MFNLLVWLTTVAAIGGAVLAYRRSGDVFHPLCLLSPMLVLVYGWMPLRLPREQLDYYFGPSQLVFVQSVNLLGVSALVLGCLASRRLPLRNIARASPIPPVVSGRLLRWAVCLGSIGYAGWWVSLSNVGGFGEAYSQSYGGGWHESGYVRDASYMLLLVGILLVLASMSGRPARWNKLLIIGLLALPWATHGLLGARRGPTFVITVTLVVGWYFVQQRRPGLLVSVYGGIVLGLLILLLVSNRKEIYVGSELKLDAAKIQTFVEAADPGNEYIYGGGALIHFAETKEFFWFKRYLVEIFVRPIPSAIWPTKYQDAGVPQMLENAGTGGAAFRGTLGWAGSPGAYPAIVGDMWIEMWWLAIPGLLIIGRLYLAIWRRAVTLGGGWAMQYTILAALSIYLALQGPAETIFRLVFLSSVTWFAWVLSCRPSRRRNVALANRARRRTREMERVVSEV
jgi:hypothetical protein